MPKRVIDFDAMWASDKLAACAERAQPEYAWLYGLADCAGCFELTNLRVIWGRVSAIRKNFSLERLEQVFDEFHAQGLLFIWNECGKRYGHWTGSEVLGRLPPPSWRNRLERLAPPVPREQLAEYVAAHSSGVRARAASATFEIPSAHHGPPSSNADDGLSSQQRAANAERAPRLQMRLEPPPAQGLDLDWEGKGEVETLTPVLEDRKKVCEEGEPIPENQNEKENPGIEKKEPAEIGFCGAFGQRGEIEFARTRRIQFTNAIPKHSRPRVRRPEISGRATETRCRGDTWRSRCRGATCCAPTRPSPCARFRLAPHDFGVERPSSAAANSG